MKSSCDGDRAVIIVASPKFSHLKNYTQLDSWYSQL